MAKLYFRYGAMNSGKSTALLQAVYNYHEQGRKVLLLKPSVDTKGDRRVVSRLGVAQEVDRMVTPEEDLLQSLEGLLRGDDYSAVFVDEAQFLTRPQVDQLMEIVVITNIPVLAYGLRTDFQMEPFPGAQRLLEIAHSIEELKTICRCGKKAIFNARKSNGQIIFDGDQVAIDGDQVTYESLCAECYLMERKRATLS